MYGRYTTTFIVFLSLIGSSCSLFTAPGLKNQPEQKQRSLIIFAAASLNEAFNAIRAEFEGDFPGVQVEFNFAGSQQLVQQLAQGASADVFASAGPVPMDQAVQSQLVDASTRRIFIRNRLTVILPAHNPAQLNDLNDLANAGVHLVLAAKEVPAGKYALDFLNNASLDASFGPEFLEKTLLNVVSYEENVKAVVAKVVLGEADAGIVYSSDVTGEIIGDVIQLTIPENLNVIAEYPIAMVRDSINSDLAQAFIDTALSETGQKILAQNGFMPLRSP